MHSALPLRIREYLSLSFQAPEVLKKLSKPLLARAYINNGRVCSHEEGRKGGREGRRRGLWGSFFIKSVKKTLPTRKVCVILRRSKSNSA